VVFAPDGIEWLAAKSQAAFDAGEEDFRAGRLDNAARNSIKRLTSWLPADLTSTRIRVLANCIDTL